jgi:hypothetical protein
MHRATWVCRHPPWVMCLPIEHPASACRRPDSLVQPMNSLLHTVSLVSCTRGLGILECSVSDTCASTSPISCPLSFFVVSRRWDPFGPSLNPVLVPLRPAPSWVRMGLPREARSRSIKVLKQKSVVICKWLSRCDPQEECDAKPS